jgi:hypothetical protein
VPRITFTVKGTTSATMQAMATQIATAFFGSMTGVTMNLDGEAITPDEIDGQGIPTSWQVQVTATK